MELWIRSKDKKCLILAEQIEIIEYDEKTFAIEVNNWAVGSYKTKERALEVLDEIHQRLLDLQTLEIDAGCWKTIKRNINCVYEMPKE